MKKLFLITGLMFSFVGLVQATEITKTSATGTTFKFTATLDSPLTTGNKVKIDFGKGSLKAMTCSAKTCTLSSNVLPTGISTATYKIGIYDAKNVLQGSTSDGTYVISSTGGYTKIANDGSVLSDSAKLGTNPTDWACTKDNKTGLIWEVKTTDGGLHDKDKSYILSQGFDFATSVNQQGLCGAKNWRMPTNEELKDLVYCSDGKYNKLAEGDYGSICSSNNTWDNTTTTPTINTTYFPNTQSDYFWSSSPSAAYSNGAWIFNFNGIGSGGGNKDYEHYVRLVR